MEKYEKEAKEAGRESWYLSWALDSTPQERAKGKTVEVGRAYFETPTRRYTILDAPGHKTYVPSMISGAAQADVAVLVISARKGEFETGFERGGQTREHIMLVKTAGVTKLICAINKMDDPTVEWSKARYDEIKDKMTPFFKGAGFSPKTDVTFLAISGYTGANLKDKVAKSVCPWWEYVLWSPFWKSFPYHRFQWTLAPWTSRHYGHGRSQDQCSPYDASHREIQGHGYGRCWKNRIRSLTQG